MSTKCFAILLQIIFRFENVCKFSMAFKFGILYSKYTKIEFVKIPCFFFTTWRYQPLVHWHLPCFYITHNFYL